MEVSTQEFQAVAEAGRALATIRVIKELRPHTNADKLELAIVDGWQCVVIKGDFTEGQAIVYFEIDSWIPTELAPFLSKGKEPREYEGAKGERLRTIRLRGEVSQGLVLGLNILPSSIYFEGDDVTEILNVKKWERPLAANMRGQARGNFPNFIQKTDQERIQNRLRTLEKRDDDEQWEVTLKLDGSSTTFYCYNGETGVCSRNLELKTDESNAGNIFVQKYHELGIDEKLKALGRNIAIQGELWGAGINGNWEGITTIEFNVFDVFDCDTYKYLTADERYAIIEQLDLKHTPIIGLGTLEAFDLGSLRIEDFLKFADRPSVINTVAEGVVFKSLKDPNFTFKVINNKFLLSGGE